MVVVGGKLVVVCDVGLVAAPAGCDIGAVDVGPVDAGLVDDGTPVVEGALKQPTIAKLTLLGALFSHETSRYTANITLSYSLAGLVDKISI